MAIVIACMLWLWVLRGFESPEKLVLRRRRLDAAELADIPATLELLGKLPGVKEVAVVEAEQMAYMKVDKALYESESPLSVTHPAGSAGA